MVLIRESSAATIIDTLTAQLEYQDSLIKNLRNRLKDEADTCSVDTHPSEHEREEIIGAVILVLFDNLITIRRNEVLQRLNLDIPTILYLLTKYAGRKYPHPRTCGGNAKQDILRLEAETGIKICG